MIAPSSSLSLVALSNPSVYALEHCLKAIIMKSLQKKAPKRAERSENEENMFTESYVSRYVCGRPLKRFHVIMLIKRSKRLAGK
jgi:hypothetical protein